MPRANDGRVLWGVLIAVTVLMSGCFTFEAEKKRYKEFRTEVRSIADTGASLGDRSFIITSAMPDMGDEDLEFKRVAKWVKNALVIDGYEEAANKDDACLLVRLAFGRGEPQTTTYTYVTRYGYSVPVGAYRWYIPPATESVSSTTFKAHIVIEAYALLASGKLPQVWKTSLSATNIDYYDFRNNPGNEYMDMIAAAVHYIGDDTAYRMAILRDDPEGLATIGRLKQ